MSIEQIKKDALVQKENLSAIVAHAIEQAKPRVDSVEVSINQSTGISISTRMGETENVEFNSDGALGITVYQNQRKGSASTNDLSPQAIAQTIDMAINIMQYTSSDPYSGLGEAELMAFDAPDLDLFYPGDLNVDEAIEKSKQTEEAALAYPKILNSDGGYFSSRYGIYMYGNSLGMLNGYCASSHSLSCSVIAKQDEQMERNYAFTYSRDINDLKSPLWIGQQAAEKTIAHLGAKQIETMQVPVLFCAEVAVGLIRHLVGAISGGAIYRKSSFLLDSVGERIFPSWLTIFENPFILKGIGSSPFDSEGTRTVKRNIIEHGVLQTYLLSNYSARKLGLKSTGHAGGIHNWLVSSSQTDADFNGMLAKLDKGIVVTSLMGDGVNNVTGDYSRGETGFWVENGQIQYPINEFTVAGNLKDMYQNIVAIGNDLETRSNIQCGSILIENISIAGR